MKLFKFVIPCVCSSVLAASNTTEYSYQYDNEGYINHQVRNDIKVDKVDVDYTHNETTAQTSFFYDVILGKYNSNYNGIKYSVGFGGLYGTDWNFVPMYYADVDYNGFNLNVMRNARASAPGDNQGAFVGSEYTRMYSDDITLTYEYQMIPDKLSFVIGGKHTIFADGVTRSGVIFKAIYNINDNFILQYHGYHQASDENSTLYFNKKQLAFDRLLLTYVQPMLDDNLVLKISAGPALVDINSRREIVPYYEGKIIYAVSDDVKLEANHMCMYSVYEYNYCQVGGSINVNF